MIHSQDQDCPLSTVQLMQTAPELLLAAINDATYAIAAGHSTDPEASIRHHYLLNQMADQNIDATVAVNGEVLFTTPFRYEN